MRTDHRIVLICLCLLVPGIGWAQNLNYGHRLPLDPEATTVAGIGSFDLMREGDVAMAKVLDKTGARLASCEIGLADELTSITCAMEGGSTYRLSLKEGGSDFEDLNSGEFIHNRWVKGQELREGLNGLPWQSDLADNPVPGVELTLNGHWVVDGSLTQEEAAAAWGDVVPVLAYTLAEVDRILGGWKRAAEEKASGGLESAPGGLQLTCPFGEPFCDYPSQTFNEVTLTSGSTKSACCAAASSFLDTGCRFTTGVGCCANSLCDATCSNGSCTCHLKGYFFACPEQPCV